jgi:ABC-2 type transport system ATP-binding protein
MASHFVEEMEQIFTDAIFLKKGIVALVGETEELRNTRHQSIDEIYLEMFKPCGN